MPILNVKIAAQESRELTAAVSSSLIELTTRILKKKPGVTSVAIAYLNPEHWIVGGMPLSEQGKSSFYFDIKITDETNTKAEKEQYIREAYAMFAKLLGNVHEVSYIYVEDVRATAYGYGVGLHKSIDINTELGRQSSLELVQSARLKRSMTVQGQ